MQVLAKLNMQLGECPRWNAQEQTWYWVDITGQRFYRYNTTTEQLEHRAFKCQPACFAFTVSNEIILTTSNGIYKLCHFHAPLALIAHPEQHIPSNRFNDGVPSPNGDFIIGSIGDGEQPSGCSYRFSLYGNEPTCALLEENFTIINGQAFSPDGKTYYITDTPTQIIYQQSYDQTTKQFGSKEIFYRCAPDEFPDGAAVDAAGNYWVAMYGSSKISVISPQGYKIKDIKLPVSQPTMVAFGGKNLDQLLVTTAAQWLPEGANEPDAGSVFIIDTKERGHLPSRVRG